MTLGIPSFEAVASGNTLILENASFISELSFTIISPVNI
jgi:hypothetical protein